MRYFGTDGIRDRADALIASGAPYRLGAALSRAGGKIIVARDTRSSSDAIERQLVRGLLTGDAHILLAGVLPTPALAYIAGIENADNAIMITASHNPPEYNGLKVFGRSGRKLTKYEEEALDSALCMDPASLSACDADFPAELTDDEKASALTLTPSRANHRVRIASGAQRLYRDHILSMSGRLDGFKLRLDLAYGCYAELAGEIFEALGAEVICENDVRDGGKVNVDCGSTHMDNFIRRVKKDEIGFAFDGDGDRALAVVDGKPLDGDGILLALATMYRVQGKLKKKLVVGTALTNTRLQKELSRQNIALIRTEVGDKNILDALERSSCPLGGESSGHILMLDRACTGDGLITALALLEAYSTLKGIPEYSPYPTLRLDLPICDIDEQDLNLRVREAEKLLDGKGRVIARKSGTEPCVRLTFECFFYDCSAIFDRLKKLFA